MTIDAESIRPRLAEALGSTLQLGEVLGVGGFAAVFRARDPFLERDVAIKVLDPNLGVTHELEEQFLREARVVAGVEHPHIVPLYAAESKNGLLYLVMRLLPGQSLADKIAATGPLPFDEAARLAHEIAMALATAHANGVVHRDIKPDNILLDGAGHATVTDFGISRVTARPGNEAIGVTVGTPRYMSPEQGIGEEVDGRADVYSLGVVLYEMLTGKLPFEGRNIAELISKHVAAPPPKVSDARPDTPVALVTLVNRMLAKDRHGRPTAEEAVKLLAAARTPEGLLTPKQVKRKKWKKRLVLVGVAGATGLVVLIGAIYVVVTAVKAMFANPGQPAAMSAVGTNIPDSLIAAARAEGSLHPDEHVHYAFIPGGLTTADALLWGDTVLIRRSPAGAKRYDIVKGDIALKRQKVPGKSEMRGLFIVNYKGAPSDTLYDWLSGAQISAITLALTTFGPEMKKERTQP